MQLVVWDEPNPPREEGANRVTTYDVHVTLEMQHSLVVEADTPLEAQVKAFTLIGDRPAEKMDTHIEVEVRPS